MLKLKEKRKEAGLTRKQLADIMDISAKSIANYEYGVREPKLEMLRKLADYFGCSIDELVD